MDTSKEPLISAQAQIDRSHYKTLLRIDNHLLVADEPIAIGGTDVGPNPQGLFLASLGSCTAITLRMYIDRKMWIVDKITVDVNLFNVNGASLITLQLNFEGDLTDEQRNRLLQIADACPVHKLLTGGTAIETAFK